MTTSSNLAPSFTTPLSALTVVAGIPYTYSLPTASDPEGLSISYSFTLPSFASSSLGPPVKIAFSPMVADAGTTPTVTVTLSDGTNTVPNNFVVTVNAN